MNQKIKILIGVLVIGVVVISGLLIWNKLTLETKVIGDEKYCQKDSDCVFLDFIRCCPPSDPCKRKPPMVVNKWNKEKIEQEMKAKCPPTCPQYAPPLCFDCLNIEKFTPICVDNKCIAKREINCEEYCKAVAKNESEPCPWISNPDLITEENTEKCGCKIEKQVQVILATDKTEYEQGEVVKIIIENNSDKSGEFIYQIERINKNSTTIPIRIHHEECNPELPVVIPPEPLPASSTRELSWNQKDICTMQQQPAGIYRIKADITLKEYEKNKAVKEEKFTVYSNEFKIKEKTTFTKDELKKIIQESTKKYYSSPEEETLEEDFYLGCKTIVYSKEILPHNIAGPALEISVFGIIECPQNISSLSLKDFIDKVSKVRKLDFTPETEFSEINSKEVYHNSYFGNSVGTFLKGNLKYEEYIFKADPFFIRCIYTDQGTVENINFGNFQDTIKEIIIRLKKD